MFWTLYRIYIAHEIWICKNPIQRFVPDYAVEHEHHLCGLFNSSVDVFASSISYLEYYFDMTVTTVSQYMSWESVISCWLFSFRKTFRTTVLGTSEMHLLSLILNILHWLKLPHSQTRMWAPILLNSVSHVTSIW